MTRLPLAIFLLAAAAVAQSAPLSDLVRVNRPWPSTMPGSATDLAVGAFVADHPGRCAAIVRDGQLVMTFQPTHFVHWDPSPISGVTAIATMPSIDDAPDLLIAGTATGAHVLRHGDVGFEDVTPIPGPDPAWAGAAAFETMLFDVPPYRLVLAHAPGWVKAGALDSANELLPPLQFTVPAGETVLDAVLVDWQPGGWPEIAVLTTTGTFVFDALGAPLASSQDQNTAGTLLALEEAVHPTLVQVVDDGADWRVTTLVNLPSSGLLALDGGSLALPTPPTGLAQFDLDDDQYPDVVLSTGDSIRRILPGTPLGISANHTARVDIADVRPDELPPSPLPNLVPLVVDDIDRDGREDFVIAQRPTDRLVVIQQVRKQIISYAANGEGVAPEAPGNGVAFRGALGVEPMPNFASTPIGSTQPLQNVDMAGLRLELPAEIANHELAVVVYEVQLGGQQPAASDAVGMQAIAHYRYPLNGANPGEFFDIQVPVPDAAALFPTLSIPRYLFEISLVQDAVDAPPTGTTPLLLEYAVQASLVWPAFAPLLNPESVGPPWAFEAIVFDPSLWETGETRPMDPIPGTRYFGAIVVVKSQEAQTEPPQMPPPLGMGNGVAH